MHTATTFGFSVTGVVYLMIIPSQDPWWSVLSDDYSRIPSQDPGGLVKNFWGMLMQHSYRPDAFSLAQPTVLVCQSTEGMYA